MKKGLFLLFVLTLLSACNTTKNSTTSNSSSNSTISSSSSSSSVEKLETVEEVLNALKNNFTVNYTSPYGSYNVYRTKDYIYDEELGGGQFILYDDTMYVYTLHNNIVLPKTPYSGTRETFETYYPEFNVSLDTFSIENDIYTTTDTDTLTQIGLLINSTPNSKADLFMDNGFLNFRLYDSNGKVVILGKVFGIGGTSVQPLDNYLKNNIDPETEVGENAPLINVLGNLYDNFTFVGKKNSNDSGLTLLLNEQYVAEFTGTEDNKEKIYGYISLNDGLHEFSIEDNITNVDFEIVAEKNYIEENYKFSRHDFKKFKLIEENTYISSDYYNVKSFMDLLLIDDNSVNMIKIKVDESKGTADISLMYNHSELYSGVISNIETTTISSLTPYLNNESKPELAHYKNENLVQATRDLAANYTFVRTDKVLDDTEKDFYGIKSNENGRKEYKSAYNNFPSIDYIVYDDVAFPYVVDLGKATPQIYNSISKEEFNASFTFEAIDFTHFMPIGENKWMTNSKKYMRILAKLIGGNPYDDAHKQANISLINDVIYIEIEDPTYGVNISGYLTDINTTTVDLVDNFKNENEKPTIPTYENNELITVISEIREKSNFTVEYHNDPDAGLYFTAGDYDYWTKDSVYFGYYKDGLITASKSGYIYDFGWTTDDDDVKTQIVNTHPSAVVNSIKEYNPIARLTNDMIKQILPYENGKYISYDSEIISIFVDALQLGTDSIMGYAAVILSIDNGNLVVDVVDQIVISYDENEIRSENPEIFASATFTNVGTTVIPSFANLPTIK